MGDLKRTTSDLKFMQFTKLHERVQIKYEEMQRKIERSMSMDSLYGETLMSSSGQSCSQLEGTKDDSLTGEFCIEKTIQKQIRRESVVVEEVEAEDVFFKDIELYFSEDSSEFLDLDSPVTPISTINKPHDSALEYSPKLRNRFSPDNISVSTSESHGSCEYINKLEKAHVESEHISCTPTPPTKISFRDRIGSKILAAKEKRELRKRRHSTTKEKEKEKMEGHIFSKTIKQDIVNVKQTKKNKIATVTVALIEANGLKTDYIDNNARKLSCRLKLGTEKVKSKIMRHLSTKVEWLELFHLTLYDDDELLELSLWDKEVLLGKNNLDLSKLTMDETHTIKVKLKENADIELLVLLTVTGTTLVNTVYDAEDYNLVAEEIKIMKQNYAWHRFKGDDTFVGYLKIIVYGAMGLFGSTCHCVLEIENNRLQTPTEYRTNCPNWMKAFSFKLKDITSILEITIVDDKKTEDVGNLSISLLDIKNGEKKWYALKDSSHNGIAKGNNPRILLEMSMTWNIVKASLTVINPKEHKYLEHGEKLDRRLFSSHLTRAKVVVFWVIDAIGVIKNCFEWKSTRLNLIVLFLWLTTCWFFKIWMTPLMLLIPFAWYRLNTYYIIDWEKYLIRYKLIEKPTTEHNELKINEDKEKEEKTSLRQKFNSIQEMVLSVQSFIGKLACFGESIKNLFNFTVPYLSYLAIFFISVIALVMYLIPVQYIFMIWGVHKFTRKILNPNRIPNNEVLDLLSRVPDDEVLLHCQQLPLEETEDIVT